MDKSWTNCPLVGSSRFEISYGYNISLASKDFERVNRSNINFNILLSPKDLKKKGPP